MLRLPLAQHGLRGLPQTGRGIPGLGGRRMARDMVRPVVHEHRVQPYPLLRRVEPLVLEAVLADGAYVVDAAGAIWYGDVFRTLCLGRLLRAAAAA